MTNIFFQINEGCFLSDDPASNSRISDITFDFRRPPLSENPIGDTFQDFKTVLSFEIVESEKHPQESIYMKKTFDFIADSCVYFSVISLFLGYLFSVACMFMFTHMAFGLSAGMALLLATLAIPGVWLSDNFLHEDRRHAMITYSYKPYVIYLRPFRVDDSAMYSIYRKFIWLIAWVLIPFRDSDASLEKRLIDTLKRSGTPIAIGRPEDVFAPEGADRHYVHGSRWKEEVEDLLRHAHLVILVAGQGKGVTWEMMRVRALVEPGRVLLVIPKYAPLEVEKSLSSAIACLKPFNSLPETDILTPDGPQFFRFDEAWRIVKLIRIHKRKGYNFLGIPILYRKINFKQTLLPYIYNAPECTPRNAWVGTTWAD